MSSILVPAYSSLWYYMSIELTFSKYGFFWIFLVLLLLVTGFVAGVYPAIHISSFAPVKIIRGNNLITGSGMLSSVLLVLQFTIILSLIGMFNLVSLDIIKRTKEVGIRKIQGGSVPSIMFLISRKFFIVLLISSLLGCAGGYYLSVALMDSIWDYFVKIGAGILLLSASIMIITTILTISLKVVRAAMKNPVESLRYE